MKDSLSRQILLLTFLIFTLLSCSKRNEGITVFTKNDFKVSVEGIENIKFSPDTSVFMDFNSFDTYLGSKGNYACYVRYSTIGSGYQQSFFSDQFNASILKENIDVASDNHPKYLFRYLDFSINLEEIFTSYLRYDFHGDANSVSLVFSYLYPNESITIEFRKEYNKFDIVSDFNWSKGIKIDIARIEETDLSD